MPLPGALWPRRAKNDMSLLRRSPFMNGAENETDEHRCFSSPVPGTLACERPGGGRYDCLRDFGTSTYTFEGYRNGSLVGSQMATVTSPGYDFKTVNSTFPSTVIDRLFVTADQLDSLSVNIDNINVSRVDATVPEPTTFVLFAVALAGRGVVVYRRRNR